MWKKYKDKSPVARREGKWGKYILWKKQVKKLVLKCIGIVEISKPLPIRNKKFQLMM